MTWFANHWLQLVFTAIYLAILARHAWEGKQRTNSLSDFLVAGRSLGGWVIALSFYATFMSTNTFVGAAGKSWDVGLVWCTSTVIYALLVVLAWFLVAPRFVPLTRQYKSLTVADFLGYRYDSTILRRMAAAMVCFSSLIYLVAIYKGSAIVLENLLDIPYALAALAIFAVVTSYTLAGGFASVVLTDALQGLLMVVGAVALLAAVLVRGGGVVLMWQTLRAQDAALVSWQGHMSLLTIAGVALSIGLKLLVEPRQLSRLYGLRDDAALRTAAVAAPLLIVTTYLCVLPIGALAHALVPPDAIESSDQVVPYLLGTTDVFGPLLGTLFLLVLVSAAMSSIDSVLLVAASSIDHDLFLAWGDDARAVRRTRVWIVALSLLSMFCALSPYTEDIVTLTSLSGSLYGACFLPALVVGLFWKRGTSAGAISCVLCGSTAVVGWFIARRLGWTDWHEVYFGLAAGMIAYLGVSVLSPGNRRLRADF